MDTPLDQIIKNRFSCRSYTGELLQREQVIACIEAARLAPSACNGQPLRYFVTISQETISHLTKTAMGRIIPNRWMDKAGAVVALATEAPLHTKIGAALSGIAYQQIDCGIAGEHLVLKAEELGLGSCWIGWFEEKKVRQILDIPKHMKILSLISLGHPTKPPVTPSPRHPLSHILFFRK
jgi:nitroreductase